MYINNNLNTTNLIFGPELPIQYESVSLAFISSPALVPDSTTAALSAERYAKENYNFINSSLSVFDSGLTGQSLSINCYVPAVSGISNPNFLGSYVLQSNVTLADGTWTFDTINTQISLAGLNISLSNTWFPIIKPGIVYRNYSLTSQEPNNSWLRQAIPLVPTSSGTPINLILIYSIPESRYSTTTTNTISQFPPSNADFSICREKVVINNPNQISYYGNLDTLVEVKVNGVIKFSGQFDSGSVSTYVKSIDKTLKNINFYTSFLPDDIIEIKYYSYQQYYYYSGYRDQTNTWYPFDANPEYGHFIGTSSGLQNSADLLEQQMTLYAIPSACIKLDTIESGDSNSAGTLNMTYFRAYDFGETHFVRHISSSETSDSISSIANRSSNTWGFATLGSNYYDEIPSANNDTYSNVVPSMMPLGRVMLTAPVSIKSVGISDVRQRGGGVPKDFPFAAVESEPTGLDTLKSMFDMGNWIGQAYQEGGIIDIQIDSSLLKTDETDTNPNTFLYSEIDEIVKRNVPPGIDYTISFTP